MQRRGSIPTRLPANRGRPPFRPLHRGGPDPLPSEHIRAVCINRSRIRGRIIEHPLPSELVEFSTICAGRNQGAHRQRDGGRHPHHYRSPHEATPCPLTGDRVSLIMKFEFMTRGVFCVEYCPSVFHLGGPAASRAAADPVWDEIALCNLVSAEATTNDRSRQPGTIVNGHPSSS